MKDFFRFYWHFATIVILAIIAIASNSIVIAFLMLYLAIIIGFYGDYKINR